MQNTIADPNKTVQGVNNFYGSVGNVATGSHRFEQRAVVQTMPCDGFDVGELALELSTLRIALASQGTQPEHFIEIEAVTRAEIAAKQEDRAKSFEALTKAGKWTLDVATKVGLEVAAKAIERALGICA